MRFRNFLNQNLFLKFLIQNLYNRKNISYLRFKQIENSSYIPKNKITPEEFEFWNENGFLVLRNFFDEKEINNLNSFIEEIWEIRKGDKFEISIDIFIGTEKERRVKFKDAEIESKSFPYKLNDLFLNYDEIRQFILNETLVEYLFQLLDGEVMVCNSLNFEKGSGQGMHFDTLFMPPIVENKMLATWIALEDGDADSGPLAYYPKSHKIKPYLFSNGRLNFIKEEMPNFTEYIEKNIQDLGLKKEIFIPKKGDVFIWHAQLLHGGEKINNPNLTRKSLVSHYFRAKDSLLGNYKIQNSCSHYLIRKHQAEI